VRRFALAIALSFFVPFPAFSQHQGTSNSTSSSSGGSSGSYHGGSSGDGGGGGAAYHSSGSSSGSSGYSGGSGGYSGGSHSSAPSSSSQSGGYSGGGSSSSHSTTNSSSSSSSAVAGNANSSLRGTSSHSNIRLGLSGLETPGVRTGNSASPDTSSHSNIRVGTDGWQLNRRTPDNYATRDLATLPTPGSPDLGRPDLIQDPAWLHQPIRLLLPPQNLDKHTRQEIFAERARAMGLEPSKSSFKGTMASMGDRGARHVSWIARIFGKNAKSTDSATPPVKSELRLCHGKECKVGPIPPKPCAGSNCPSPSTKAICGSGFRGTSGSCQPWGYLENCSYPYTLNSLGHCRVRWAAVDSSYCWQILRELERRKARLDQTMRAQTMACSADSHGTECMKLTQQVNQGLRQVQQLQQQYRMCAAAAGLSLRIDVGAWPFHSWPAVVWP
jgi:hypothetical protein